MSEVGQVDVSFIRKVEPGETGVGPFCAPGPARTQSEAFIVRFADANREDVLIFDREEARRVFAQAEAMGWNCYLFELARRKDGEGEHKP